MVLPVQMPVKQFITLTLLRRNILSIMSAFVNLCIIVLDMYLKQLITVCCVHTMSGRNRLSTIKAAFVDTNSNGMFHNRCFFEMETKQSLLINNNILPS